MHMYVLLNFEEKNSKHPCLHASAFRKINSLYFIPI